MHQLIHRLFLFLLPMLMISMQAEASDIMGADMSYRCVGTDSFEFTTIVYKDCNANWSIPANVYNLYVSAINCSFTPVTYYPQQISCKDITPVCDGYCTKCNSTCNSSSSNGSCSFAYGIEKLTYKVIVYLGGTSCCDFHIGYIGNSTRNHATTTCCNSDLFYTYVELNRCQTSCNSSPIFTNDPVGIICAGQDFVFNNGALDSMDGDSMSFELAPAMRAKGQSATYYGSYSYTKPLNFFGFPNANAGLPAGFHLDPVSGDLAFRPMQANQIAVVVIKVTEWRRVGGALVKIGETRRDMQFIIISCPNNKIPSIESPFTAYACAGQKTCMDIITNDSNSSDTVRISWNRGIRGATFTHNNGLVKHAKGQVCWTPTESDISNIPYSFTITAEDDACPIKGQSIRSFNIFVRETPRATISTKVLDCGKVALHYIPDKNYPGFASQWVIRDENQKVAYGSGNNAVYDTAFINPGKYQVSFIYHTNTPCYNIEIDSLEIPDFVEVDVVSDSFICIGDSLLLDATTWNGSKPYSFGWSELTDSVPFGPFTIAEDVRVKPDTSRIYVIQVEDADGCMNWDTVRLQVKYPPPVDLGPDQRVCQGDTSFLDAGNDSLNLSYYWVTGETSRVIAAVNDWDYWVRVTDSFGCYNSDTMHNTLALIGLDAGPDRHSCEGDTVRIGAIGGSQFEWYDLSTFTSNPLPTPFSTQDSFNYIVSQSRGFVVRGKKAFDTLQCAYLDTVVLTMDPKPYVDITGIGPICPDDDSIHLITAVQFPTAFNGTWTASPNPQAIANNIFYPLVAGSGNHALTYKVTDSKGCPNSKTINVNIRPAPSTQLMPTFDVCANEKELVLNSLKLQPANYNGLTVNWYEANGASDIQSNLDKSDPTNVLLKLNNAVANGVYYIVLKLTNNVNGCSAYDTCILTVRPIPNVQAGSINPVCFNDRMMSLFEASNASPSDGIWTSNESLIAPDSFLPASIGESFRYTGNQVWFYYTRKLGNCAHTDSVSLSIKPQPKLIFEDDSLCMNQNPVDLSLISDPDGSGRSWTGTGLDIQGSQWNIDGLQRGWYAINYSFTAANACSSSVDASLFLEALPTLEAIIPDEVCEGSELALRASYTESPTVFWSSTGDGLFDGLSVSHDGQAKYKPGIGDVGAGQVTINIRTEQASVCPEAADSKLVRVFPLPRPIISVDTTQGCEPLTVLANSSGAVSTNSMYVWDFGEGSPFKGTDLTANIQHTYNAYGIFQIELTVTTSSADGGCTAEAVPVSVEVYPQPRAIPDANKWTTTVNFPGIQFYDHSITYGRSYITKWEWDFGDPNFGSSTSKDPFYTFPILDESDSAYYRVHLRVTSNQGCWDSSGKVVLIVPELSVFIPNAFTPTGHNTGLNDHFVIVAGNYKSIRIHIYNRWGEEIYYSENADDTWDGRYKGVNVPEDVYAYLVEVESIHNKAYRYSGTITLIR
ncbi:MAG: T9SS type B sorting domain-containing protein [Bacteroidetes bacterium]|nr:T9SS type B sorting domain-containing protein [Bacteroidota bacterium]